MKQLFILLFALLAIAPTAFANSSGGWKNQEFKVKGSWSIEQRTDGNYIVLSDEFKTKNAPDLKLFVSKKPYGAIKGNNATQEAAVISLLSSNKGGQSYKIPSNINLSDYQSLVIHCEQYSKLWASTPL
jgi:hypothetical protein